MISNRTMLSTYTIVSCLLLVYILQNTIFQLPKSRSGLLLVQNFKTSSQNATTIEDGSRSISTMNIIIPRKNTFALGIEEENATVQVQYCGNLIHADDKSSGSGLGNRMFEYASAYGAARMNGKRFLVHRRPWTFLKKSLNITGLVEPDGHNTRSYLKTITEQYGCCTFDENLLNLPCDKDVRVSGYMQSWKYFHNVSEEIRREFQPTPFLHRQCTTFLNLRLRSLFRQKLADASKCVRVGVHLRRGNFALPHKMSFGHSPATVDYLQRAVSHFEETLSRDSCIVFLVLGNDYDWNKKAVMGLNYRKDRSYFLVLYPNQDQAFDLCLLTRCQHTILSTGTFGWWAAYLNNGHTTYQALYAMPGSWHSKEYKKEDYFPPHWIGL